MAHTPGMPANYQRQVERVRNDGNWINGDPLDVDYRPWNNGGRIVLGVPGLHLRHDIKGGKPPHIPGWKTPRYGFSLSWGPNDYTMFMEYTPIECNDPLAPPKQLTLF